MSTDTLRSQVIKLAHAHPEFRGQLLPLVREATDKKAGAGQILARVFTFEVLSLVDPESLQEPFEIVEEFKELVLKLSHLGPEELDLFKEATRNFMSRLVKPKL